VLAPPRTRARTPGPPSPPPPAAGPPPAAAKCLRTLTDASNACSATLNAASQVAYSRLDRVFGSRGGGSFRVDLTRFFHLAVRAAGPRGGRLASSG
jgi:hypothetical protein